MPVDINRYSYKLQKKKKKKLLAWQQFETNSDRLSSNPSWLGYLTISNFSSRRRRNLLQIIQYPPTNFRVHDFQKDISLYLSLIPHEYLERVV